MLHPPYFGSHGVSGAPGGAECPLPTSAAQARLFLIPCLTLSSPSIPGIIFQINDQHPKLLSQALLLGKPKRSKEKIQTTEKDNKWNNVQNSRRTFWVTQGSNDRRMSIEQSQEWNSLIHLFKKMCIEHLVGGTTDRVFWPPRHLQRREGHAINGSACKIMSRSDSSSEGRKGKVRLRLCAGELPCYTVWFI